MADIKEAIRRLIYEYTVEGAEKVMATQEAVAASTIQTDKASLSLEKAFGSLERRYVETVRHQQDYQKVQEKVNAAVAQNPELQERANAVLAAAGQHYSELANKGGLATTILSRGITALLGPAGLLGLAITGIGYAFSSLADKSTTVEQTLSEQNRLMKESLKLIDEKTSKQERMFAQSPEQTQFQLIQAEIDARKKLAEVIRQVAAARTEAETGGTGAYDQIDRAVQSMLAGTSTVKEFNAELARIALANPAVAQLATDMMKVGESAPGLERVALQNRAISDALGGVATNAQMAAAGLGSIAQFNFDNLKALDAAHALERMANEADRLATIFPTLSYEGAKQVELLNAQLKVAQARTEEEKLIAQEILRQIQLRQQGVAEDEAALLASKERRIAEENITRQQEQQASRQDDVTSAVDDTTEAVNRTAQAFQGVVTVVMSLGNSMRYWGESIEQAIDRAGRLTYYADDPFKKDGYSVGGMGIYQVGATLESATARLAGMESEAVKEAAKVLAMMGGGGATNDWMQQQRDAFFANTDATNDLTGSTNALNATMQSILSPYYSQDPRTTKLGFRAGSVGNADWMVAGASNANPLAAVLGYGATAPGMANGGSFVVGGGYSANDNKIAAFPVASGEQVVVNRNRQDASGNVVNIDNRIIINGAVDADAMSQLKVSRYQQAQRMRAGLARA